MKMKSMLVFLLLAAAGCQKEAAAPEATSESAAVADEVVSTRIVLRLTRSGAAEVLDVIEQPGVSPLSRVFSGNYVYEVRDGSRILAVESFNDPFEERSASEDEELAEHIHRTVDEATISVRVPGVAARGRQLAVRIHKLTRSPGVEIIDSASVESMVRSGTLARVGGIEAAELAPRLSAARRLPQFVRALETR